MIPEELKDLRPYSHEEMDRLMTDYSARRSLDEQEARRKEDDRLARAQPLMAAHACETEAEAPDSTTDEWAQDAKRRLLAMMEGSRRPGGGSTSRANPESADSASDVIEPVATDQAAARDSGHSPAVAAPIDSIAKDAVIAQPDPVFSEAKPAAPSSALDQFPVARLDDVPNVEDPARELAALCREVRGPKDYLAARDRYCLISIRMNVDGLFAPAFRQRPRVQAPKGDAIHMQMHRDRLVIDSHWCHATRMELSPTDPNYAHLLDLEHDFDFAAAWSLARRNQLGKYRAGEALCLTPVQQSQTMSLHGLELKERLERVQGTYRKSKGTAHSPLAKATAAIGKWVARNKRIQEERRSYEKLWLAQAMLGEDGTDQDIADLHALMLGKRPLHRRTIAGKLATLNRNVDITLKPSSTP